MKMYGALLKMIRVAIITNSTSSLLNFRKELIQYLVQRGIVVYGFSPDFTDREKEILKEIGAIPIDYPLARGGLNPFIDIRNMVRLTSIIKKINPDIVFSTFSKPVIFGTLAAKFAGVRKVLAMLEGLGFFFTYQPEGLSFKTKVVKAIQILLYKFALPKADKIIFLNNDDPRDLLMRYKIKVKEWVVLGGIGVSLSEFTPVPLHTEPVIFIFVGRLLREKGIFELIQAGKEIKRLHKNVIIRVVGDIDESNPGSLSRKDLNSAIQDGIIEYIGPSNDVKGWLAKSSVFVLPSYREGLPRSTQEAMAMGMPIITTDVPGCRETVIENYNGFLIKRWASNELAQKMAYFIENPDEIIRMGRNSRFLAEQNFDVYRVNERLYKLIIS